MFTKIKSYLSTNFFDEKLRTHSRNYILQSLLIFLCITVVMLLYGLFGGIIVASLGASSFILFVTPRKDGSRARFVIGGYVCGAVIGTLFSLLNTQLLGESLAGFDYTLALTCAASAAVTTFAMISTNSEHPPAAALALGLAADKTGYITAAAALAGVILLCLFRRLLKKWLIDLI